MRNSDSKSNKNRDENLQILPVDISNRGADESEEVEDVEIQPKSDSSIDVVAIRPHKEDDTAGVYIIAIVAGISAAATVGLIAFGIGWYK